MATVRTERAVRFGIATLLLLTMGLSAVAYSYLRRPGPDDPQSYFDLPERNPDDALNDIAAVLAGSRGRYLKTVAPETFADSHQVHFSWRDRPLLVRVLPDSPENLTGKLVWDTPGGARTICRGVRPGGFQVMELTDAWVLKLVVVRMDRVGGPTELMASKMVKKPSVKK